MITKKYFVHISSNTIAHYIVGGCIRPTNLIERRENDIQTEFPNFVLLSSKKWSEHTDCSIEVIIKEKELSKNSEVGGFQFYNGIIPISRITGIYFSDKEKAKIVIWNLENGAGFIPKHLIHFHAKNKAETCSIVGVKLKQPSNDIALLKRSYQKFNRLLGGLAFLRVGLSELNDKNLNFPVNYISTISFFNDGFNKELLKAKIKTSNSLHSIFSGESTVFQYLASQITEEMLFNVSSEENIEIESKFGTYKIDNLPTDSLTFKLGVLYTYGNSGSKSVEDLLSSLMTKLDFKQREEIALIFGINTGYQALRNFYKINERSINVKFELNSELDHILIESIYNYAFNNHEKTESVDYLNDIFKQLQSNVSQPIKGYTTYNIFNTQVVTKIKDYREHLESMVDVLITEVSNWFPFKLTKNQQDSIVKKIKAVLNPAFKIAIGDIKYDIEEDLRSVKNEKSTEEREAVESVMDAEITDKAIVYELTVEPTDRPEKNHPVLQAKLSKMTVPKLKEYAKNNGIKIPAKMKKEEIVLIIIANNKSKLF